MEDISGVPWVFIHLGIIVLAIAVIFGIWRNRARRFGAGERQAQQNAVARNFRQDQDSA